MDRYSFRQVHPDDLAWVVYTNNRALEGKICTIVEKFWLSMVRSFVDFEPAEEVPELEQVVAVGVR